MAERNQAAEISVGIKCRVAVEKIITSALSSLCVWTFGSMVPSFFVPMMDFDLPSPVLDVESILRE
jgi:hypothetical protein